MSTIANSLLEEIRLMPRRLEDLNEGGSARNKPNIQLLEFNIRLSCRERPEVLYCLLKLSPFESGTLRLREEGGSLE